MNQGLNSLGDGRPTLSRESLQWVYKLTPTIGLMTISNYREPMGVWTPAQMVATASRVSLYIYTSSIYISRDHLSHAGSLPCIFAPTRPLLRKKSESVV